MLPGQGRLSWLPQPVGGQAVEADTCGTPVLPTPGRVLAATYPGGLVLLGRDSASELAALEVAVTQFPRASYTA